jgi:phospholipid/cholesterol/gamma-HCH transport system substrate-binding protein
MTSHLKSVSEALDSAGIDRLTEELVAATVQFKLLLEQLNSGEGTAGKLIYSDTLYYHLENLVSDLDSLVMDLNENPQNYVRFSLFGNSQK